MALLRTLIQEHTPTAMMGRIMGLSALAMQGAFPIGSIVLFVLVRAAGLTSALVISGALCTTAVTRSLFAHKCAASERLRAHRPSSALPPAVRRSVSGVGEVERGRPVLQTALKASGCAL